MNKARKQIKYCLKNSIRYGFSSLASLFLISLPSRAAEPKMARSQKIEAAKHHESLASNYWVRGNLTTAIAAWKEAAYYYQDLGLKMEEAQALTKVSQGYIGLGQFRLAIPTLEKALSLGSKNQSLQAKIWRGLGNALGGSGEYPEAIEAYQNSLAIEPSLATLNNLVAILQNRTRRAFLEAASSRPQEANQRTQLAEQYQAQTREYAQQALDLSQSEISPSSVRALIEWGNLSPEGLSRRQLERGRILLKKLPPSRSLTFLLINWAKVDPNRAVFYLSQAQDLAVSRGDPRTESFALVELAQLFEESGDLEKALQLAQKAQLKAQAEFAYDSLYRGAWLAGRIYRSLGEEEKVKIAYREAIASLDEINKDLVIADVEQRLDFRTQIEPVYRELLSLLLDDVKDNQANLLEAIQIFDKLRLAQLQNYFGDDCFEINREGVSTQNILAQNNAALINSIILENKTYFILQLPDGTIHYSEAQIGEAEIEQLATEWRKNLQKFGDSRFRTRSQDFYNLIVRPFEKEIAQTNPEVLVFVHDGVLRNLPMAALSDGEKFLAEKWASVTSIGLNFTPISSKNSESLEAAAFGLGVSVAGWNKLDYVEEEVKSVEKIIGGEEFLNQEFTADNFTQQLNQKDYSVVHLATHGYFGGTAETSFILAYDRKLSALELDAAISQSRVPIEMLVLSACETAVGSDRSVLGIAGVAARSGVSSTLGSLWSVVDEEQTEFIEAFYSNLQDSELNKAQALQKAQIEHIEAEIHPKTWAALNLIGNWK